MSQNASRLPGRHFLHIPGPTPVPDRVLRAIDMPLIDQRGPDFAKMTKRVLEGIKTIFKTTQPVIIYTATGTGAWEAALTNTLSPGDRVLMVETGQFATLWKVMAERLGLKPEFIRTDWRVGADPKVIEEHLRKDKAHEIKAVCVLHNETATGCLSPIGEIRKAIDAAGHPALFLVDTISPLASADYRHDEWGVDVTVGGAQKGLMMPPGMSFNAVSEKALHAAKSAKLSRSFFQWDDMLTMYKQGFFPYTPATANAVRPRRVDPDAARGRARQRLCASRSAGRSDAPGGARLGPRNPLPRSEILFAERHRGAAAGRPRCGSVPQPCAQHLQYRLRCELRSLRGEVFPHRPYGRRQRHDDGRCAGGDGNGAHARRRAAQEGRRAGGDGLHRVDAVRRHARGGGVDSRAFPRRRESGAARQL